jgi:uncharacterized protein
MHWTLSSVFWGLDAVDTTIASYGAFLAVYVMLAAIVLSRSRKQLWSYIAVWIVYPIVGLWAALFLGRDIFDALNLLAMAVFIGGVGLFAVCAYFAFPLYKKFATVFTLFAVTLAVVGIDAFILEPGWLEVRHEKVVSNKLHKPIRIAILSDLQTDHVGKFERDAFKQIMNAKPDMVLLPGDYIQAYSADYPNQVEKLRTVFRDLNISAPLGVYATEGDAEGPEWTSIFKDLPVKTFPTSDSIVVRNTLEPRDDISLTALTLKDSWRLNYKIPESDKFHIVVAHRPDFMLNATEGDLFVAGHTHGGQVQLPIYGPLLTFSRAPREWCGGCCITQEDGRSYIITRGVGMERERAPRLRFFCRPEIVVVDVVPSESE